MEHHSILPKRIILVRHGESQGNLSPSAYTTTPDPRLRLTDHGLLQARLAGSSIRSLIASDGCSDWRVFFYVSPYERTGTTLREMGRVFGRERVLGVREECRVREQDFGNFQVEEGMRVIKETRERFGRFFFRFPEGESAADVYDRVSSFLESLWRDIDMNRLNHNPAHDLNLIIMTHGLTARVFLMKWFKWTVEQFEQLNNLDNCGYRVMQLGDGGEYSLAIHHTEEEMREWGFSQEMIEDQNWRARAKRGDWNDRCPWYLDTFFDHMVDSDNDSSPGSGENDLANREEMHKDVKTLIKEQLEVVIRNVKNSTKSFRREAERCRVGVLTCEEAREKAEAEFILKKKRTAEWESPRKWLAGSQKSIHLR